MSDLASLELGLAFAGLALGLGLLARGIGAYRRAEPVADTATSRIDALAVGSVRVTGVVEPAELTLVSALQSRTCVYYRSRVRTRGERSSQTLLAEERAVGFRVRDGSGAIRVFPRDARWDVPAEFHDLDGFVGEEPVGLEPRTGPAVAAAAPEDREAAIARLLTVVPDDRGTADGSFGGSGPAWAGVPGRREYEEARIEPGHTVTVVGSALPFDELDDPEGGDLAAGSGDGIAGDDDPEIVADLAAARAGGGLRSDARAAWGNAAIPGFGIGRPVSAPVLDPAASKPRLADPGTAERFRRTFAIGPTELVLAALPGRPLLVSLGPPVAVVGRARWSLIVGLLGAALAIGSAVVAALIVGGVAR